MSTFEGLSILIVDDEEQIRSIIKNYLQHFKAAMHEVSNGKEALKFLSKKSVDLTILDIKMPEMDGLELLRNIKVKYPEITNIILTGFGNREHVLEALKLHAYDFLEKPLEKDIIVNRVSNALKMVMIKKFFNTTLRNFLSQHCDEKILAQFDGIWEFLVKNQ